jgi:hypothetical protein
VTKETHRNTTKRQKFTTLEENEISVFRAFAEISRLAIDSEPIEKRSPPESDILCRLRLWEASMTVAAGSRLWTMVGR